MGGTFGGHRRGLDPRRCGLVFGGAALRLACARRVRATRPDDILFDHDVGRLAHSEMVDTSVAEGTDARSWEETADDKSMTAAGKIRKMLRSPESIREVYIISEILKRPE